MPSLLEDYLVTKDDIRMEDISTGREDYFCCRLISPPATHLLSREELMTMPNFHRDMRGTLCQVRRQYVVWVNQQVQTWLASSRGELRTPRENDTLF